MENELALQLFDVRKQFGAFTLEIPQMRLPRGVVLGLIGQNGAGKSTLIKILINLIYPDQGEVHLLGLRQPADELAIKQRLGYVSENPTFYEELTVCAMARIVSGFYPNWDRQTYEQYLAAFALDPRKRIKQLSKGMKVKLGVTLALSHRPELLILDEPTSGIDPVMRRELLQEIMSVIQDERRTVVFSSHITQDVEQIADYVAILQDGKLAEFDDRESLLGRWRRVSCTRSGDDSKAGEELFVSYKASGRALFGVTKEYGASWLRKGEQLGLCDCQVHPCTLETILLSLAGKEVANNVGAHL